MTNITTYSIPSITSSQLSCWGYLYNNIFTSSISSITASPYMGSYATPGITYSDISVTGAFKIKDLDVGKSLEEIKARLAIITPDLKKLEKYQALKKAYDNYKMIEALCNT